MSRHYDKRPNADATQTEWLYLVGEAHAGELLAIRTLSHMLHRDPLPPGLRVALEEQLDDEVRHAKQYQTLLGHTPFDDSGFARAVGDVIEATPSMAGRLFALQGLVEGLNLGVLQYRLESWAQYPGRNVDLAALEDEKRHVGASDQFMGKLKKEEGPVPESEFRRIEKSVGQISRAVIEHKQRSMQSLQQQVARQLCFDCFPSPPNLGRLARFGMAASRRSFLTQYGAAAAHA